VVSDVTGNTSSSSVLELLERQPATDEGRPPLLLPVLVLASPDDRLVPVRGVRATAARYGAELVEFPGMGHDLMLDARWREPLDAMFTWLEKVAPPPRPAS